VHHAHTEVPGLALLDAGSPEPHVQHLLDHRHQVRGQNAGDRIPNWIDGEFHATFNYQDIIQFSSPEYWYFSDEKRPILSAKRPRSLLIALFVGTNQVVIDNNMIDALRRELGTDELPVTFVFNDSNTVPVSYFGSNISLEEAFKAFMERGIKIAEVPMWWQGDYHLTPTIEEFDKFFEASAANPSSFRCSLSRLRWRSINRTACAWRRL
jgi:hypothetical protein